MANRRGYFAGVGAVFGMMTTLCTASVPGTVYFSMRGLPPPSVRMHRAASCTSSSGSGPFIAANTPPTRTSGRQSSQSIVMRATARDVTTSKLSRSALSSSARPARHVTFPRPTVSHTSCWNVTRFWRLSMSVMSASGARIAATSPGNPAPEPTSAADLPERRTYRSSAALSRKCSRAVASSPSMAVRFITFERSLSSV